MKQYLIVAAILATLTLNLGYLNPSRAETTGKKSLIQMIIEKFGLSKQAVETEISTYRKENQSERLEQIEIRLSQAVKDGKLTEAQKVQLLEKFKTWQETRNTEQNLSREEKITRNKQHREEMDNWAKENNVNLQDILGHDFQGEKGKGMGQRRFF